MKKFRILLIGTGGTITAKIVDGSWRPGSYTEKDLINFIPEIKNIARVKTIELFQTDSSNIQPYQWVKIARLVYNQMKNFDGIIITGGTDTMHYTASALSFMLQNLNIPVILTGAQIPPHKLGSDVRRNLLDSIRVVKETDIAEVVIVFNSKILRGNRAKKFRELEFEAFESVGMLPLGYC